MNKLLLTVLGTTLAVLAEAKGSSGGGGGGSEVKVSATDDGDYALVGFDRCYKALTADGGKPSSSCYMYVAAYVIVLVAFIIIGCSNYCTYCPNGVMGKKDSDQKNKPCACIIGTTAGMAGLMLVPIGAVVYCVFAPFTCFCKKDDEHKGQKQCNDCAVKMRDFSKWLMKAPVKLGKWLADKFPC